MGIQAKKNASGEVVKHKARLMVKGNRKVYEIDCDEVFFSCCSFLINSYLDCIGSLRVLEFASFGCEICLLQW